METKLLFLALFISSVAAVPVDDSRAVDSNDNYYGYRLPNIYSPSLYVVSITVLKDVFNGTSTSFTGTVTILFQLTNDTEQIELHAPNANVSVVLNTSSSSAVNISNQSYNETTSILTLNLNSTLQATTECDLVITYEATLSTSSMRGFYRSVYEDVNGTQYLVTTQFQPTHAREAFPCFDEPHLKAEFMISITYPTGLNAISNTPQINAPSASSIGTDYEIVTFETTPKMSTYLIAFIVSKFTCTSGRNITGNITHQVCSRNDTAADRALANEVAPEIMEILENITGITYSSMNLQKMDEAALPDFSAGAMENWGLVTYRETALLWNSIDSSNTYKQRAVTVIAHEFAHMWFGNLVTLDWWDYTFLNEGFARYFQYFATEKLYPAWEMALQFIVEQQQSAFVVDGSSTSSSLTSIAASPSQIENKFGTTSYNKGAAVLRMTENFIGSENFISAIREYLSNHSSSTTVPSDLVRAFEKYTPTAVLPESISLSTVLANWLDEPGYPVVTASLNGTTVTLSQKRFMYSGNSSTEWYVPISYTPSAGIDFSNVSASDWLIPQSSLILNRVTLSANEWIIINNRGSAYYRVNYDSNLWSRISQQLNRNHSIIDVVNRAQIIDDLFNLARAGLVSYNQTFTVVEYMKNETEYYPWYSAINGFNFLLNRYGENSTVGARLISWQLELLQNVYNSVSFTNLNETDHVYSLKLSTILIRACKLGHANCISDSKNLFQASKNGTSIDKNLKTVVYCAALRYSDNIEEDWQYLWELYKSYSASSTMQVTLLSVFGCTKNTTYLTDALERSLNTSSGVRLQDFSSLWSSVYSSNEEGIDVAFNFFVNNHERISSYYSGAGSLLSAIASRFTTEAQLQNLNAFINSGNLSVSLNLAAEAAALIARSNLNWASSTRTQLEVYFDIASDDNNNNTGVTNATAAPNVTTPTPDSANMAVLSTTALLLVLVTGIFFR